MAISIVNVFLSTASPLLDQQFPNSTGRGLIPYSSGKQFGAEKVFLSLNCVATIVNRFMLMKVLDVFSNINRRVLAKYFVEDFPCLELFQFVPNCSTMYKNM